MLVVAVASAHSGQATEELISLVFDRGLEQRLSRIVFPSLCLPVLPAAVTTVRARASSYIVRLNRCLGLNHA